MSDTQKIVDALTKARDLVELALLVIALDVPNARADERVTLDLLQAAGNRLSNRIAAHSNALQVQS